LNVFAGVLKRLNGLKKIHRTNNVGMLKKGRSMSDDDTRQIKEIKRVFCLTDKELSKVFLLSSRRTITNWTEPGSNGPKQDAIDRIFNLVTLARDWEDHGYTVTKSSLHLPLVDGKSLLTLLSDEAIDKSLILFSGSRLTLLGAGEVVLKDPFA
jgi:hypothetical protein